MIIDIHAHYVPPALLDVLHEGQREFPSVGVKRNDKGLQLSFAGGAPTRPVSPRLSDAPSRIDWMAEQGIDRQVVGGWLDMFGYELPADEGAAWSRLLNEHMLTATTDVAEFVPLASVPLQDGRLAARILNEAMDAGFPGAMIGTQPRGVGGGLDDPDLDPFWQAASDRNATVFIHPMFACGDDRLADYGLVNAVGRVTDSTIAVARLLYAGHLTRFPGMNVVLSHGGAALPFILGRLRRNQELHRELADPQAEFRKLYFDTVVFESAALRFLRDVAGAGRLMLGSDQPFPIGDPAPQQVVRSAALDAAEERMILGETAAGLFLAAGCGCGRNH